MQGAATSSKDFDDCWRQTQPAFLFLSQLIFMLAT